MKKLIIIALAIMSCAFASAQNADTLSVAERLQRIERDVEALQYRTQIINNNVNVFHKKNVTAIALEVGGAALIGISATFFSNDSGYKKDQIFSKIGLGIGLGLEVAGIVTQLVSWKYLDLGNVEFKPNGVVYKF